MSALPVATTPSAETKPSPAPSMIEISALIELFRADDVKMMNAHVKRDKSLGDLIAHARLDVYFELAATHGAIGICEMLIAQYSYTKLRNANNKLLAIAIDNNRVEFILRVLPDYCASPPHMCALASEAIMRNPATARELICKLDRAHLGGDLYMACNYFIAANELFSEMDSIVARFSRTPGERAVLYHQWLQDAIAHNTPRLLMHLLQSRKVESLCMCSLNCCLNNLITDTKYSADPMWEDNALAALCTVPADCARLSAATEVDDMPNAALNVALRFHRYKIVAKLRELGFKLVPQSYDANMTINKAAATGNLDTLRLILSLDVAPSDLCCSGIPIALRSVVRLRCDIEHKIAMADTIFRIFRIVPGKELAPSADMWFRDFETDHAQLVTDIVSYKPCNMFAFALCLVRAGYMAMHEFQKKCQRLKRVGDDFATCVDAYIIQPTD